MSMCNPYLLRNLDAHLIKLIEMKKEYGYWGGKSDEKSVSILSHPETLFKKKG